jgi:hypothetical protein
LHVFLMDLGSGVMNRWWIQANEQGKVDSTLHLLCWYALIFPNP